MGYSPIEKILLENLVRISPANIKLYDPTVTTIDGLHILTITIDDMTPPDIKSEDKIKQDNRIKDRQTWKHTKYKHGSMK